MAGDNSGKGKFASLLLLFQGILLILFVVFSDYGDDLLPSDVGETTAKNAEVAKSLHVFQDIHVIALLGFGLTMTFLKRYCQGSLIHSFLIVGLVVQWATLLQGFFNMKNSKVMLSIKSMVSADFAAISVLVSFGAVLGKANSLQLLTMALLQTIFYSINEGICTSLLMIVDNAKTMFAHVFGALFGITVARLIYRGRVIRQERFYCSSYDSGTFALIGTIFLWVYWPSMNAYNADGSAHARAIVNTFYALAAGCIATFAFSVLSSSESRFNMAHIQNSSLAGGIAVGAVAQLIIQPWGTLLMGIVGSLISVICFRYILVKLAVRFKIHDTKGILASHAFPGLLGSIASIIATAMAEYKVYKSSLYRIYPARAPMKNTTAFYDLNQFEPDIPPGLGRTGGQQAAYQASGIILSIAFAIFGGLLTGLIVRTQFFDPVDENDAFNDFNDFEENFYDMEDIPQHDDDDDLHDNTSHSLKELSPNHVQDTVEPV